MKPLFWTVATLFLSSSLFALENPVSPVVESAAAEEPKKAPAEKPAAAAESKKAEDLKAETASPAEKGAPVAAETSVKDEVKPAATKTPEKVSESAPQTAEGAAAPAGFVVPLGDLVAFHEKEIASVKKMMDHWDKKAAATLQRRAGLQAELKSKTETIDKLNKDASKAGKREASRLSKDLPRINKDIATVDKELKALSKELYLELKETARETQQSLTTTYQQTGLKIQQAQK